MCGFGRADGRGGGGIALLSLRPDSGRWDREYYGALECSDDADPLRM